MKKSKQKITISRVGGSCPNCNKDTCLSVSGPYGTVGCNKNNNLASK